MPTIEHSNPEGNLEPARLDMFEAELGCVLSGEYRAYLLEHNGGIPVPNEVILPQTAQPVGSIYGMYLLTSESGSLEIAWWNLQDILPNGFLPIGELDTGDLLCLGIAGTNDGHVYYVRDEPDNVTVGWDQVVLLAKSFNAFIAALGRPQPGETV